MSPCHILLPLTARDIAMVALVCISTTVQEPVGTLLSVGSVCMVPLNKLAWGLCRSNCMDISVYLAKLAQVALTLFSGYQT